MSNFHWNHWVYKNVYIIHRLYVRVWSCQSTYTQPTGLYVHGNAFCCARMYLRMDLNNVAMCVQCHKFGTLEQWIVWARMRPSAHNFWYMEDGESHIDLLMLLKSLQWKKLPKAKNDLNWRIADEYLADMLKKHSHTYKGKSLVRSFWCQIEMELKQGVKNNDFSMKSSPISTKWMHLVTDGCVY